MATKRIIIFTGFLLTSFFVVWSILHINFTEVAESFARIRLLFMAPVVTISLISIAFRAYRWQTILRPSHNPGTLNIIKALLIGNFYNMILPVRMGELARVYFIGKRDNIGKSYCLGSIVTERIYDLLSLLLLILFVFFFASLPDKFADHYEQVKFAACVMGLLVVFVIVTVTLSQRMSSRISTIFYRFRNIVPEKIKKRFFERLQSLLQGAVILFPIKKMSIVVSTSLLLWFFYGMVNYFVFYSFQLDIPLSASFVIIIFQSLGIMLPSTPGFIGPYHGALIAGLSIYDVDVNLAFSVAVVSHAVFFLLQLFPGSVCLIIENFSFSSSNYET